MPSVHQGTKGKPSAVPPAIRLPEETHSRRITALPGEAYLVSAPQLPGEGPGTPAQAVSSTPPSLCRSLRSETTRSSLFTCKGYLSTVFPKMQEGAWKLGMRNEELGIIVRVEMPGLLHPPGPVGAATGRPPFRNRIICRGAVLCARCRRTHFPHAVIANQ